MINNKKIVAMIPARLGSQRIHKKNLRILGDKVLTQWVGKACLEAQIFDDIYINSESNIFEKIASDIGIKFYQRPKELASNSATNDDFGLDFINNIDCDILVQVNPTSPFVITSYSIHYTKLYEDINFHIQTNKGEYGLVEDAHMILDHILYSYYISLKPETKTTYTME